MNVAILPEPSSRRQPPPVAFEPLADLSETRVAILGCGSVGGAAAWCLGSAGVPWLELADRDRLEPANLRRHICGAAAVGRSKAEAVADFLGDRFPHVWTVPHDVCFLERPDELRRLLERCDLALAAVDTEAPKHLIDAQARELGRPVVYAGIYGGGWAAELIRSDADTPCYACTARALGRVGVPVEAPPPGTDYARPLPAVAPSAWPRADLTSILPCAALAAQLVVAWLARQHDQPHAWDELTAKSANAWRLALRRVPAWDLAPGTLCPVPVDRLPECPVCGERAEASADLDRLFSGELW